VVAVAASPTFIRAIRQATSRTIWTAMTTPPVERRGSLGFGYAARGFSMLLPDRPASRLARALRRSGGLAGRWRSQGSAIWAGDPLVVRHRLVAFGAFCMLKARLRRIGLLTARLTHRSLRSLLGRLKAVGKWRGARPCAGLWYRQAARRCRRSRRRAMGTSGPVRSRTQTVAREGEAAAVKSPALELRYTG
jgi:hypothetical protein